MTRTITTRHVLPVPLEVYLELRMDPGYMNFKADLVNQELTIPEFDSGTDEEGNTYNCAEQYMMAAKARVMGDTKTLAQILACDYNPTAIKQLGRRVTPYSEEKWVAARLECVTHGNFLKFSQNAKLRKTLMQTGDLTLVEAAPTDRIWGIGRSVNDAAAGASWQGQNLLGKALMAARAMIESGQKRFEAAPAAAEAAASADAAEEAAEEDAEPRPKKQRSGEKSK